jgi:Na+-translocating ferredoxin:NAD+ oxidoreductase RnfA subunit
MLDGLIYYFLFSSMVLVHGAGFTWGVLKSDEIRDIPLSLMKNLICVTATSMLTSIIVRGILLPLRLTDLMPFVAVLIFAVAAPFCEALIRITAKRSSAEMQVPLLCVIFGQFATFTSTMALAWSLAALVGYYGFVIILYTLRKRMNITSPRVYFSGAPLLLISIAIIMFILHFFGIAWINTGAASVPEVLP